MMRALVIALMGLGAAAGARAQAFDAPSFLPPRPGEDVGVYLFDQEGAEFGIAGIWRQRGNLNLGLRVGFLDYPGDGAVLVGAETWGGILDAGPDFPVDVSWTLGAGAAFNGGTVLEIPAGLTIGRALVLSPLTFQVYGHPRIALLVASVADQTDTELEGLFDLGADLHLNPDWKIRLGFTLGGIDAWGIGAAYRFGRGVAVR